MTAILQSIIGSISSTTATVLTPLGDFYWNGSSVPYSFIQGAPGSVTSLAYNFPNGTTANTVRFDGNGFEITPNLGLADNFWLDFWFYPTSFGVAILTETNGTSPGYYYNMLEIDNDGHIYAGTWDGGGISRVISTDKVILNAWNHIYFYFENVDLHLEVNGGSPVTSSGINRSGPGDTYIGVGYTSATAMFTSNPYRGYIETIYGATTTQASRYNSTKSKYQAQQVFDLDGSTYPGTGDQWVDSIGNKSFTLYSGPVWENTNGGQIWFQSVNGQWADTPTSLPTLNSFSVQGVFKLHSLPTTDMYGQQLPQLITEYWPGNGTKINYSLGFVTTNSNIAGGFFDSTAGYWNAIAITPGAIDNWYDITITYDGNTKQLRAYLNGALQNSGTMIGTAATDGTGIRIARRWDAEQYLDATIKTIKIWDGVLTESEVSALHTPYSSLV